MTRILFFGRLRDAAGASEAAHELPASLRTVADVRAWISAHDPHLGAALAAPGVRVAVDQVFAADDTPACGAGEIAFMAPLSGG